MERVPVPFRNLQFAVFDDGVAAAEIFLPVEEVPVWFMNPIFWPLTVAVSSDLLYHTFGLS